MRAMVYTGDASGSVEAADIPEPCADEHQVLIDIAACGVCRTDLHVVDGELPDPKVPIAPGHEVVGRVREVGRRVTDLAPGDRVGVPWLGWTCGTCAYCASGRENLCREAKFTGYQLDGGYAEAMVVDARYAFRLPDAYDDVHAAPLLCAGLIGHRAYRMAGDAQTIGLYGFGAAAHILIQVAVYEGRTVYAFSRPGDDAAQGFARDLGAAWSGASGDSPPQPMDAAILFAPVGGLVPEALQRVVPGATVVCAGIHMSDIPSFPYSWLWEERSIRSVANLTRRDAIDFLEIAPKVPVRTEVTTYPLANAALALDDLRGGRVQGAAVLQPEKRPVT